MGCGFVSSCLVLKHLPVLVRTCTKSSQLPALLPITQRPSSFPSPMNPSTRISLRPPLLLLLLLLLSFLSTSHAATTCYTSIFSFGDSLADTGNLLHYLGKNNIHAGRLPYGETYFRRPTGRFSDGRLVVDFIAEAMGLPFLPPYLAGPGSEGFRRGVNFAVAGATAIENGFFREKGIHVPWSNTSLGSQIEWFTQLLPSLCSSASGTPAFFPSLTVHAPDETLSSNGWHKRPRREPPV